MDYFDYQEEEGQEDYEYNDNDYFQQNQGVLKILMVAEKNSIAEAVAYALGNKVKAKKGRQAFYYYSDKFKGQQANFTVTATNGHLFNRDFPKDYENWSKCDPIELFSAKTIKKPANKAAIGLLRKCSQGIDYLILWLDNDREGENICFEVDEVCNQNGRAKKLRAKFSSITSTDIRIAYNNLNQGPNLQESLSVDARQVIDLKVGVAFSRFQTLHFQKKYQMEQMITFGPCQTPTLGFCVQRHEEIINFIPKTYFILKVCIQNQIGFKQEAEWLGQQIWKEQEAKQLVQQLSNLKFGDVTVSQIVQKSKVRPEGINTVALLKFASTYLGVGPQQAMHIAEKLYLRGYISYPRTESTAYPQGFPTAKIIYSLTRYPNNIIKEHAQQLSKQGFTQPKNGIDVGDHPPITPTENVPANDLNGDEKGMYEFVTKMFLANHSGDCRYDHCQLKFKLLDQEFKLSSNKITDPGFTKIATWLQVSENNSDLSKYITNQKVQISSIDYKSNLTTPPDHLTETELIGLMDKFKIGTDASMATHINNICERSYVQVEGSSRKLKPTDLGLSLVRGYKRIDPDLVAPQLRSNIESQVDQIAKGKAQYQQVIDEVIKIFSEKYKHFRDCINDFQLIQYHHPGINKPQKQQEEAVILTKCGDCHRYMTLVGNNVNCSTCNKSYPLLPDCKFKALGTQTCPYDKFELIYCTSNKSPFNTTFLCPKCFTDSPIINSNQCTCNICPNKQCPNSMENRKIGNCKNCKCGELVLEPFLAKGSYINISCNECWYLYQLIPQIHSIHITKEICNQCQLSKLDLTIKEKDKDEQKLTNICFLCDEELSKKLLAAPYLGEKKLFIKKQIESVEQQNEQVTKQSFSKKGKKYGKNQKQSKQQQYEQTTQQKQTNDWGTLLLQQAVTVPKKQLQQNEQQQQQQQQGNKIQNIEPGLTLIEPKKKK